MGDGLPADREDLLWRISQLDEAISSLQTIAAAHGPAGSERNGSSASTATTAGTTAPSTSALAPLLAGDAELRHHVGLSASRMRMRPAVQSTAAAESAPAAGAAAMDSNSDTSRPVAQEAGSAAAGSSSDGGGGAAPELLLPLGGAVWRPFLSQRARADALKQHAQQERQAARAAEIGAYAGEAAAATASSHASADGPAQPMVMRLPCGTQGAAPSLRMRCGDVLHHLSHPCSLLARLLLCRAGSLQRSRDGLL